MTKDSINTSLMRTKGQDHLICSPVSQGSHAGGPPIFLWNKTFGGDDDDYGQKIRTTSDNGMVIFGSTRSFTVSDDFWLLKLNAQGDEQWNHTYGTPYDDFAMDVQQTADGGYILVGYHFFFHSFNQGILLVKTDGNGIEEWNTTFGSDDEPADAVSVYQTKDSGYVILGNDWTENNYLYVIKTNADGALVWSTHVASQGYTLASEQTSDDGFIITGAALSNNIDLFLMKINATFAEEWAITRGSSNADFGLSVIQTSDNAYVAAGVFNATNGSDGGDAWIVRADAQGHVTWDRTIGGSDTEIAHAVQETTNGYVLVGRIGPMNADDTDLLVVHTDTQGVNDTLWSLGGTSWEEGYDVLVTSENEYVITGYTWSFGTGGKSDLWLVKLEGVHGNAAPNPPTIDGPTSGKVGIAYPYSFIAVDPDGDEVSYYIEWGDGTTTNWTAFHPSGAPGYSESHVWKTKGTFIVSAKAKDNNGNEGKWSTLEVTAPLPYEPPHARFFTWLFERFPNAFPILRSLLGY